MNQQANNETTHTIGRPPVTNQLVIGTSWTPLPLFESTQKTGTLPARSSARKPPSATRYFRHCSTAIAGAVSNRFNTTISGLKWWTQIWFTRGRTRASGAGREGRGEEVSTYSRSNSPNSESNNNDNRNNNFSGMQLRNHERV